MVTRHGLKRAQERTGFTSSAAARLIERAIYHGIGSDSADKWNKEYLEKRCVDGKRAVLYNGFCVIIGEDDRCITLWKMDSAKPHFRGKEKIKNVKNFMRMNPRDELDDAA